MAVAATTDEQVPASVWEEVRRPAVHLASAVWAGIITGGLIGGVGGRLAMFVLRLTSDPSLHGVETDDGFLIGSFTGSMVFLFILCVITGTVGALFYLVIRSWFPRAYRAPGMAIFMGAFGGATIIKPDGIDFTLVEPHALSVVFFIALPALYGYTVSVLTERFLDRKEERGRPWSSAAAILPLLGLGVLGPFGIIVLAVAFAGWMLARKFPLNDIWHSRKVTVAARAVLAIVTCAMLATLVADIGAVV